MTKKTKTEDDPAHVEPAATDRAQPQARTDPKPAIARIVHYSLTEGQAAFADAQAGRKNTLEAGKLCPAIITDVHSDDCVDLRIIIRGQDAFVTSVALGTAPGTWQWPERT